MAHYNPSYLTIKEKLYTVEEWMAKVAKVPTTESDMNKLVMNFFVKAGFKEAAAIFQQEAGLEPGAVATAEAVCSLTKRSILREKVVNGRINEAINIVTATYPDFFEKNPILHLRLLQLQALELARDEKFEEAITLAQSKFSVIAEQMPEVNNELERTMAAIIFGSSNENLYTELLNQFQTEKIASQLNEKYLECVKAGETESRLQVLLKLINWAKAGIEERFYECVEFSPE